MWNPFKRKSNEPNVEDLTAHTNENIELLNKKSLYLEDQIADLQERAKSVAKTNKPMALKLLKKKKALEIQLDRVDKNILLLQDVQSTTEQTRLAATVGSSTKMANRVIEQTLKHTNIDSIEDSMAKYQESKDKLAEIDFLIEQSVQSRNIDDDELERELEELEQEELDQKLININANIAKIPSAPTVKIQTPVNEEEDEDELTAQKLRDWAKS